TLVILSLVSLCLIFIFFPFFATLYKVGFRSSVSEALAGCFIDAKGGHKGLWVNRRNNFFQFMEFTWGYRNIKSGTRIVRISTFAVQDSYTAVHFSHDHFGDLMVF